MTLAEIKPMHGEGLYDRDGNLVGKWYGERGMLSDCFIVRERTCKVDSIEPIEYGEYDQIIGYDFKLTCGHIVTRPYMDMPPAFCDECGARVVDE